MEKYASIYFMCVFPGKYKPVLTKEKIILPLNLKKN